MSRWLDPVEDRAWRSFLEVSGRLERVLDRQLQRESGLPHTYYMVLAMLSEAPERRLRMSDLADITTSSPSRISHAVARLEELGWVERLRCPSDRRGWLASLTDEGFAVLERAAPGHVETVRRVFFDPLDHAQVEALAGICADMLQALDAEEEPAPRRLPV
ncbi:MAG: MarR family transcriptional regulator [Acidimicrobiia bacterium]|nr:MarR family transcriptional regulator [Acidimicrobiia bacterium]